MRFVASRKLTFARKGTTEASVYTPGQVVTEFHSLPATLKRSLINTGHVRIDDRPVDDDGLCTTCGQPVAPADKAPPAKRAKPKEGDT